MPEPYVPCNFATIAESQGVGVGAAGFAGAAGFGAAGAAGAAATGFGGTGDEAGEVVFSAGAFSVELLGSD